MASSEVGLSINPRVGVASMGFNFNANFEDASLAGGLLDGEVDWRFSHYYDMLGVRCNDQHRYPEKKLCKHNVDFSMDFLYDWLDSIGSNGGLHP